ncbi:MAG: tRNA (adenosine(37)-N6)-threonylcarbamoyltransferase complex ATPase subunit type 1 TsaE [Bacillota bacterium]
MIEVEKLTAKYRKISESPEETFKFGVLLGRLIEEGFLILLLGDLGSGKTLLAKGIAEGAGFNAEVSSPTFNLIQEYNSGDKTIVHMDLYRLDVLEELIEIGFEEYLDNQNIVIIEWPELAFPLLPADFVFIEIKKINAEKRKINVFGEGKQKEIILERLNNNADTGN